jgi:hypothetical protein
MQYWRLSNQFEVLTMAAVDKGDAEKQLTMLAISMTLLRGMFTITEINNGYFTLRIHGAFSLDNKYELKLIETER